MARTDLVLEVDTSTVRMGLWCPTCALPSGFEVAVVSLSEHGVSTFGTMRCCSNGDDLGQHKTPTP